MLKGWISSVTSKISRALGGAHDAEYVSEEDINTSSEIEHIEEGELAEQVQDTDPKDETPEGGTDGRGSGDQEAVDSRNIPPVCQNTSGTCVDIGPEELMDLPEDQGTGSFIVVKDNSEGSPTKIMDSSGSIEVIHPEDQDLTGSQKEQPSSELSGSSREQPSSAVMDSIVIVQEEGKGHSEPHCGSDPELTAAMMESVCRDLENNDLDKMSDEIRDDCNTGVLERTEESDEQSREGEVKELGKSRKESEVQEASMYLSEEERSRKESEIQEASMFLSEEDTSLRKESVSVMEDQSEGAGTVEESFEQAQFALKKKEEVGKQEDKSITVPSVTTTDFEPQKPERGEKKPQIAETENYLDFVQQMTEKGELVQAKDLIYKLGLLNVDQKLIEKAILDQYKIAVQRKYSIWINHCRYHAELLFSPPWIADHLPRLGSNSSKEKKKWQSRNEKRARRWQKESSGMCRDVRLKNDPSIEVVRENAADDKVDGDDQNGGDSHSEKEEVNAISDGVKEGKVELGDGKESEEKCSAQLEELSNKDKNSERETDSAKEDGAKLNKEHKIGDSFSEKERNERRDKPKEIPKAKAKEENCKQSHEKNERGGGACDKQLECARPRKKLSPCKKGKTVKAREIDITVARKEGVEKDKKDSGSHHGRERRKSDLYDKRKDRLDDSVARDSKKPKTEQDSTEGKSEQGDEENKVESQVLAKEVEEYAKEIIQSSINALSLEESSVSDETKLADQKHAVVDEPVINTVPNLSELCRSSKVSSEEGKLRVDKESYDECCEPSSSDYVSASVIPETEVNVPQALFDCKAENMVSSLSRFSEADADGSPFLRKDSGKEMVTSAFESSPTEAKIAGSTTSSEKERCEVFEESGDDIKTENFTEPEVSSLPGALLVSPDCVMTPKFEVPPNTPASGYAEKLQPSMVKNINLIQNKAKLEKEVADLLSGLTMKLHHPVGSGLEEFKSEESKLDEGKKKESSPEQKVEKKTCDEYPDSSTSIQTSDSAIISANSSPSHDICVEEMEKLDLCVKQDLNSAEEGRCSPEEYLSMLQQVLPNVTSITKLKQGQQEDGVQCGVVSSSTHTEWPPENGASMREGATQVMCRSAAEVVNVCDLSVAENVEFPCKLHTEEESDVCVGQSGEVVEEECIDQDESCFSKDDLDLEDVGMNRAEDQHNYCLSQSDGARLIRGTHDGNIPQGFVTSATKKRCNSAKSSVSKSLENEAQFTKLKLSKTLSKSEEKLKHAVKPPWNSNTKVDHGKAGSVTPSRIPKACKSKTGSQSSLKQTQDKSKSLETKTEKIDKEMGDEVCSGDSLHEVGNDKKHHRANNKSTSTMDDVKSKDVHQKHQSVAQRSDSSEKRKNPEQAQKVLSEIEKGRCQMDQVEKAESAKGDSSVQPVPTSGGVENKEPNAADSTKAPPKWKSKNAKKGKGRQKNRW